LIINLVGIKLNNLNARYGRGHKQGKGAVLYTIIFSLRGFDDFKHEISKPKVFIHKMDFNRVKHTINGWVYCVSRSQKEKVRVVVR